MQKLKIDELAPGMLLNEFIYNKSGAVVLPKGTRLTNEHIELLKSWGVVYTIKKPGVDVVLKDKNSIQDAKKKELEQKEVLKEKYTATKEKITSFMEEVKKSDNFNNERVKEIEEVTEELLTYTLSATDYASLINQMKNKDTYTYQHSVNVAIYSSLMGKWLNYDVEAIQKLSLSATLHDIGKMKVPEEILNKPGKLTDNEFEEIKNHSKYGYKIVNNSSNLDQYVALAVLQHHERTDGSGYPFGVGEDRIYSFAKIIAIADIFDAITSERCYEGRFSPFDALKEIRHEAFKSLDPRIALLFLNNVTTFFIGAEVLLSNGKKGEIVYFNERDLYNPLVKIDDDVIDLTKEESIELKDILVF